MEKKTERNTESPKAEGTPRDKGKERGSQESTKASKKEKGEKASRESEEEPQPNRGTEVSPGETTKNWDVVDEAGWESFPASDPPPW